MFNTSLILDEFKKSIKEEILDIEMYIENCWAKWLGTFISLEDIHTPFKTTRVKIRCNKWFTDELQNQIYERDYLHEKALESDTIERNNPIWQNYRQKRNTITSNIRDAKLSYYGDISQKYSKQPQKLWNEIGNAFPKPKNDVPNEISSDDFNEYFSTICSKVANDLPPLQDLPLSFPDSIYSFSFSEVYVEDVTSYL